MNTKLQVLFFTIVFLASMVSVSESMVGGGRLGFGGKEGKRSKLAQVK